jgi:cytochrome c-type biogenesis protein CcmH
MLFALVCVALLLPVLAAVSLPLFSGATGAPSRGQFDRAVYRDQLREVDRDVARGLLAQNEADSARLEIQRRLLAVDGGARVEGNGTRVARSPLLAIVASGFVVLAAGGLYWRLGAPSLPDQPFADRPPARAEARDSGPGTAPPPHDIRQAAERLEQKLAADPANSAGWVLLGRTTSMLGEWQKAADAYRHAIDLGQKGGDVYAGHAEMLVMAANGIVSPAARDSFRAALDADPASAVARYYLALADGQAGETRKAVDAWMELAGGMPEDSRMREEIGKRIVEAAKQGGFEAPKLPQGLAAAEAAPDGPTPEQMQDAASMPADQREQMIGGMIDKLAARLKDQPNDLDGWLRLGRAYVVRGEGAKAVDAFDRAAALKPGDTQIKLQTVAALLTGMKPDDALPPRAVAMLSEVAAVAPDVPEVLWYQGVVAARDGRFAEARARWTKLLGSLAPAGEDAKMVRAALDELKGK